MRGNEGKLFKPQSLKSGKTKICTEVPADDHSRRRCQLARFAAHIFLIVLLRRKLQSVQNPASQCRHSGYRDPEGAVSSVHATTVTTLRSELWVLSIVSLDLVQDVLQLTDTELQDGAAFYDPIHKEGCSKHQRHK